MKSYFHVLVFFLCLMLPWQALAAAPQKAGPHLKTTSKIEAEFFIELKNLIQAARYEEVEIAIQRTLAGTKVDNQPRLKFFHGLAHLRLGHYKQAALSLAEGLESNDPLALYKNYLLAQAANGAGDPTKALGLTNKLLAEDKEGLLRTELYWEKIAALLGAKKSLLARQSLERLPMVKPTAGDILRQKYLLGLSHFLDANTPAALSLWQPILIDTPLSPHEKDILDHLTPQTLKGQPFTYQFSREDKLARAEKMLEQGHAGEALDLYHELLAHPPPEELRDLRFKRAMAAYKARDYAATPGYFQEYLKDPAPEFKLRATNNLVNALTRAARYEEALQVANQILELYPHTPTAGSALYSIGLLEMDRGRYSEAAGAFFKLLYQEPAKEAHRAKAHRTEALWYLAWCLYKKGELENAAKEMRKIRTQSGLKGFGLAALFWEGRTLKQLGNHAEAQKNFALLAQHDTYGYYGFLATKELAGTVLPIHDIPGKGFIEKIPQGPSETPPVNKSLFNNPAANRAILLAELGLDEWAHRELKKAIKTTQTTPKSQLDLIRLAFEVGDFYQASAMTRLVFGSLKKNFPSLEGFLWQMAYPLAYRDLVQKAASEFNADQLLPFAIMRQESVFQPAVTSPADAVGLMQIIPPTARQIATHLGQTNFDGTKLTIPAVNIRFGVYYLRDLVLRFDGEIVPAIAAYNAGPEAVSRWLNHGNKLSPEELIEEIPFEETRQYVKKVLQNYWIYARLYPDLSSRHP